MEISFNFEIKVVIKEPYLIYNEFKVFQNKLVKFVKEMGNMTIFLN